MKVRDKCLCVDVNLALGEFLFFEQMKFADLRIYPTAGFLYRPMALSSHQIFQFKITVFRPNL